MKTLISIMALIFLFLWSFPTSAGKKHCQHYRDKLNNIQAQQRQGNTLKRSNALAIREDKARKIWWRCENGQLKKKPSKKKRSKVKKKKKYNKKTFKKRTLSNKKFVSSKKLTPFASKQPIIIGNKYQGKKLAAWLSFYKPKPKCEKPKSIQEFASCIENKRQQQTIFEKNI